MRLIHLTPELPCWPGGSGGATRQFHLLRRLVELGHEVTVVAPVAAGQQARRAELAAAGIRLEGPDRPPSRAKETLRALAGEPSLAPRAADLPVFAWQVSVLWVALRPHARRALEAAADVVTVEHDHAAQWVAALPAGLARALVLQNVGPSYYGSRARAAAGAPRALLRAEAFRFARHDARWLERYDRLIAVSDNDAADLRGRTAVPVEVVPNGVASDELTPLPPSSEPATLLFTGTLGHPPNAEGIRWFAAHAWPLIRSRRPDAELLIVGRDPPPEVSGLDGRDGIEVVGSVPSMAPYFERATAVVVPLLSGGGTRLKILEAFACARAVVSTGVGREGLDASDGAELLVADGAEAFATATLRLLEDPSLRERLAAAGRELAERRYDWRVLGDRLEQTLAALA